MKKYKQDFRKTFGKVVKIFKNLTPEEKEKLMDATAKAMVNPVKDFLANESH